MRTPPGVSPADFGKALDELRKIVTPAWVFTSDEDLDLYRDAYSVFWGQAEERIASAAVCPDTSEEVQQIMKVCNEYKIPIYPISTGRNLGYGGSAPNYSGSVVLDLKRMNRVLEVDEKNCSVLVEPGVSYFDLYRYFQEHKIKLWVDCPDPGWGSLIGNALDHGNGYLQPGFRNHFDSHCGMEVVLANGELVRTGTGALPGSKTWQQFKFGVGPMVDGLFAQSNFGIVTKMGFWAMPEPDAYLSGVIYAYNREDLPAFVEAMNHAENTGVSNGIPFLASPLYGGSSFIPRHPKVVDYVAKLGREPSEEELHAFAKANAIPYWGCTLKFYGVAKSIQTDWEYCKEQFAQKVPGVTFEDGKLWKLPLKPEDIPLIHKPEFGIPSLEMFTRGARAAGHPQADWGHIWFAPIIPRTGEAIFEANKVISDIQEKYGIVDSYRGVRFTSPSTYFNRSFLLIYGFAVTRDPVKDSKTVEGIKAMITECAKHGWGEYRAAPALQETVVAAYSYNDHALLRLQETLKDAIDPNGIISAGRYGVWPKHLRGSGTGRGAAAKSGGRKAKGTKK